jgi:hypothetical protein
VLIGRRRKTLMAVKEITFIFFTTLIFILQMICELLLDGYAWYVYVKLSAVVLYAAFYIDKPADGGICAFFGIWLLQLLLVIRNMIIDSYIYFDLGNPETIKISLLCALGAMFLSYIKRVVREPKKKKEISPNMELFTSSDKK